MLSETSAQEAAAIWDCSTPGCIHEATKRGPGGKPYCDECRTRIYTKKVETSSRRHGTAGGGGHTKLLVGTDRVALSIDQLTRRIRIEAKACERAAQGSAREQVLPARKHEVVLTLQALALKLTEL